MKNKLSTIIVIIILSLLAILLIGFLYFALNGKVKFFKGFNYKISENELYNEIIEEEFRKINIESTASEIIINKSNDNNFKVLVYGENEKKLNVVKNNGVLKVSYEPKGCIGFCFSFNNTIGKIEIYVPENYENTIIIKNNYGDIKIDDLKKAIIEVEEDAGNVKVKEAKNITVKNDYGNITIDKVEQADIDESAGDVKIKEVSKIKAKNDYGDIEIDTINKSAEIEMNCGNVSIKNLYITENSSIKNDFGSIKIENTSEIYFDAKTDLGNLEINNNYNKSDITLKLKNNCGDIRVNN